MKKVIKILIIQILLIISIIGIILYNKPKIEILQEPVIENKITIKAKEIHDYMRENNYGYCTYDNRCDHDGVCGLNVTFEKSKQQHHNTCCATYVSWVLQELDYITNQEHINNYLNGANNLWKYLIKKGWKEIEKIENVQPGDILCYNGHVAIYGGRGAQYDAGNKAMLTVEAPCRVNGGLNVEKILRAPDL